MSHARTPSVSSFVLDLLEERKLMSVPGAAGWVPYAQIIGQAQTAIAYPYLDGSNQNVAVVDRGVDYTNPNITPAKIAGGYNFRDNTYNIRDDYGHGTGVTGIIAANPYNSGGYNQGVAAGTHIVMLKQEGSANIKAALDWVIAYHTYYNIQVVNLTDFIGDVNVASQPSLYLSELATLKQLGIFVSTPVGNGELYAMANGGGHAPIVEPAITAFGVGGITLNDTMFPDSRRGAGLQLLGPADHVTITYYQVGKNPDGTLSDPSPNNPTDDNYSGTTVTGNFAIGTSWASAYVAGAATLLKQVNPAFTVDQIDQILTSTGTPVADDQNPAVHYPRLNIYNAVTRAFQLADDANLGNQGFASATPLTFRSGKSSLTGMKLTVGHPDFYTFNVTRSTSVNVNVQDATASPFTVLFDGNGNVIKQIPVGKKGATTRLAPGKYYVYLTAPQTLPGTYNLTVTGGSNGTAPAAARAETIITPAVTPAAAFSSVPAMASTPSSASTVLDRVKNSSLFG